MEFGFAAQGKTEATCELILGLCLSKAQALRVCNTLPSMEGTKSQYITENKLQSGKNQRRLMNLRYWFVSLISVALAFSAGVAVGVHKLPPYALLSEANYYLQSWVSSLDNHDLDFDGDGLASAFSEDLVIDGPLYYPPIEKAEDIRARNEKHFVEVAGFPEAYSNLEVLFYEQYNTPTDDYPVIRIQYSYLDKEREAFLYGVLPPTCAQTNLASLIVPGSGDNQSSAIWSNQRRNYHFGVRAALPNSSANHQYVLIKPNHDFLAWHNGRGKKLAGDFYFTWHLNQGGSYSASYLTDGLAAIKYLKGCYKKTAVVGLSQGGAAALIVSLQAEPDYAVVCSGHSFAFRNALASGRDQIVGVPGYSNLFNQQTLVPKLLGPYSRYLFTWGLRERGVYGHEARVGPTLKYLNQLPNVSAVAHDGGHVFPVDEIQAFFREFGY